MLKRVAILLFCLMMVFIATFGFVVGVVSVPTIYSYADVVDDDILWQPLDSESELVQAFQYYCKSRDVTIEGSLADAVTTATTGSFNGLCNKLGIDITMLQADIKKSTDSNGNLQFLFNETGIAAYNRIFSQFLQDNELEVGDVVEDQPIYSGIYYTDNDGNSCMIYEVSNSGTWRGSGWENYVVTYGSPYKSSGRSLVNASSFSFNDNFTVSIRQTTVTYDSDNVKDAIDYNPPGGRPFLMIYDKTGSSVGYSDPCIIKDRNGNLHYGIFGTYSGTQFAIAQGFYSFTGSGQNIPANTYNTNNVTLTITTNNNTINNNTYEGDTIINDDGDIIDEPDPVPPGGNDPGWNIGGGGGTATDGNGNTWNIQFPDFQLPDLNIDWSINGLGEKFPFSIPFDLVALVTVLNAEPQAPKFEGTVNFGFTTWDYDINLQQFDSVAQACRIAELLLLVFGLILVTRSIIKG